MITTFDLVAASLSWLPSDGADMPERVALASAIVQVTSDDFDRAMLMVVGTDEGRFDVRIRSCKKTGDHGRSLGPWQTYAVSPKQRTAICTDIVKAAAVALTRLEQSREACRFQPARFRHAAYVGGRCGSKIGHAIAERRFDAARALVDAQRPS